MNDFKWFLDKKRFEETKQMAGETNKGFVDYEESVIGSDWWLIPTSLHVAFLHTGVIWNFWLAPILSLNVQGKYKKHQIPMWAWSTEIVALLVDPWCNTSKSVLA